MAILGYYSQMRQSVVGTTLSTKQGWRTCLVIQKSTI
jgi:hypothetical protein